MNIGVFGSASPDITEEIVANVEKLGEEIIKRGHVLISGATTGLPDSAVQSAQKVRNENSQIIGYSPASNLEQHLKELPINPNHYTEIFFTNSGKKGRNVLAVTSCDAAIFVQGRIGTLNEFTIAYDEAVDMAILQGTGGITDIIPQIIEVANKDTKAQIVYEEDPVVLIDRMEKLVTPKAIIRENFN